MSDYSRSAAATALGEIGSPQAVEPLATTLMESPSPEMERGRHKIVRRDWVSDNFTQALAEALARFGDPRGVRVLADACIEASQHAADALANTLTDAAGRFSVDGLQAVARLDDGYVGREHIDYGKWRKIVVDCSEVKRLAQEELLRRGLQVTKHS